tara:strand:- start:1029 stop:2273 length:1245 start_codon:yes stop_codon:yes gene_type:complete
MHKTTMSVENLVLKVSYSEIKEQIGAHSIYLSRVRDRDDDRQGKVEFDFQKNCISLTSFGGYGFLNTRVKCTNPHVDSRLIKPIVVDIKDIQSIIKSFDTFNSEYVEIDCSKSSLGLRLPSECVKKVKNSIRVCDVIAGKVSSRGRLRSIDNIDVSFIAPILSRIISINLLTDSGSYFDFMNLVINKNKCRATSGNGSFFSSIECNQEPPMMDDGSWILSVSAIAMILKIAKKFKSEKISIVEYENCIRYKLDSFDIISLDKFDSRWPDVNSIIKRNNNIVISIDAESANSIRGFLIPILEQAQRDKVDVPSVSLSIDLLNTPSIELQANFRKGVYFTLDEEFVIIDKNEGKSSIFNCDVSLKSLIDSMNTSSNTSSIKIGLSDCDFNGHSSPVLISHNDSGECKFSSFFAQVN